MCHLTPFERHFQQAIPNGCAAKAMGPSQRLTLGVQGLAGTDSITNLADDHCVSRKFVHQQVSIASDALGEAFAPAKADGDVLFHVPITKDRVAQVVLNLVLNCHSSYRGVIEFLRDVFDFDISIGSVHNIVNTAIAKARVFNNKQDLANVRVGAHDEIFQKEQPVLVCVDVKSTYCYLLSHEDQRDGDTWGIRLMELMDRGFDPEYFVADAGSALRAGMAIAMPNVLCRSDVFHALKEAGTVVRILENRAYGAMAATLKLEQERARLNRQGRGGHSVATKLCNARKAEARAIAAADNVATLVGWLQRDVLSIVGPCHAERLALFDFVLVELQAHVNASPMRMKTLMRYLSNQRDDLLAFAFQLDLDLAELASQFQIDPEVVREVFAVRAMDPKWPQRYRREAALLQKLGHRYHPLSQAVDEIRKRTVRASSVVENLNSRLRNYFFLRRHIGNDYLALLQFFLNHRRFPRSEHPERVGKSPAELLTGEPHPHWLEMLGYQRFERN